MVEDVSAARTSGTGVGVGVAVGLYGVGVGVGVSVGAGVGVGVYPATAESSLENVPGIQPFPARTTK